MWISQILWTSNGHIRAQTLLRLAVDPCAKNDKSATLPARTHHAACVLSESCHYASAQRQNLTSVFGTAVTITETTEMRGLGGWEGHSQDDQTAIGAIGLGPVRQQPPPPRSSGERRGRRGTVRQPPQPLGRPGRDLVVTTTPIQETAGPWGAGRASRGRTDSRWEDR